MFAESLKSNQSLNTTVACNVALFKISNPDSVGITLIFQDNLHLDSKILTQG